MTSAWMGNDTAAREAADYTRRLSELTGEAVESEFAVWLGFLEDDHQGVLHAARCWFDTHPDEWSSRVAWPGWPPMLLVLAFPIAASFLQSGREADAAWIAREMPRLMEQSQHPVFAEIGDTQRWAELRDRLGGGEPERVTLEEAFWRVHAMVVGGD